MFGRKSRSLDSLLEPEGGATSSARSSVSSASSRDLSTGLTVDNSDSPFADICASVAQVLCGGFSGSSEVSSVSWRTDYCSA